MVAQQLQGCLRDHPLHILHPSVGSLAEGQKGVSGNQPTQNSSEDPRGPSASIRNQETVETHRCVQPVSNGIESRMEFKMTNTKFVVKLSRIGASVPAFVQRLDRTPIQMTTNRKLALLMGKLTAEDAIRSLQTSRCILELVSVQVKA